MVAAVAGGEAVVGGETRATGKEGVSLCQMGGFVSMPA